MPARPLLLLALLILFIAGCQPRPAAGRLMDDYLTRLSRVLDQSKPEVELESPPRMPRSRDLQVPIAPLSVNLLDYWGFRKCGLGEILGERNSVLGRVMPSSQHLHMDGRIILQLQICQTELEDEELAELASELEQEKLSQWPGRYWNATLASPELRHFLSPSTKPLAPDQNPSFQGTESAVDYLLSLPERLAEGQWPESTELESHYQQLDSSQLGGQLLQSLQLGKDYLETANRMLEQATEAGSLCPAGRPLRELEYARNVMTKIFIGDVQPWLALVNRRASAFLEQYQVLVDAQSPELQPRIENYHSDIVNLHHQFQQANRDHVRHWKALFEQCNSSAIER